MKAKKSIAEQILEGKIEAQRMPYTELLSVLPGKLEIEPAFGFLAALCCKMYN